MISKRELTKITIVSAAMILMLVNIVGAMPFDCGVTLITDNCTQSVDLLKFPACGCEGGFPICGCGDNGREDRGRGERGNGVTLITDPCIQSVDLLKFPACGCDGGFPICGCGAKGR
jgi:hypothetical protein